MARTRPVWVPSPPQKKGRVSEEEEGCRLCQRAEHDPDIYGDTCRQDGLCVHENCLYHASGLYQRGADDEGFFGFLFPDIEQELQRVAQKVNRATCPHLVPCATWLGRLQQSPPCPERPIAAQIRTD
ncbi:PHD finger protein 7-like [Meleagris gallopavo]|uniref:PHD finger protein 7-like n=1 Tax=Meleagris gallopavo TaxID=9103 RepID=UPI00094033D7|nr:PHD finger protein 7-like [Meleagris gallopavo]